ncbi:MAG: efflux RND transporter periplasmic adaptor subunit, partial [Pseudomonadota bacterium]
MTTPALVGAAILTLFAAPLGAEPLTLEFEGRVEPVRAVTVANRVDAVVDEVLFSGGEAVEPGDPLFILDAEPFRIAVEAARAAVDAAEAGLALAEDAAARQARLVERGAGPQVRAFEAEIGRRIANAELAARRAELASAELTLSRTRITAPIAGRISRPLVSSGAFVEAEAGTELARIVQLDPVLVGYAVPYAARVDAMAAADAETVDALFAHVSLQLVLPDGGRYAH